MLYTPSESVLIGNTIAFHIDVYDQEGALTDADEIDVRIVKGEQVVEGMVDTTVEHVGTGKYRYKFQSGQYQPGEFVAIWRGNITTIGGEQMYFVTQEKITIERSEVE